MSSKNHSERVFKQSPIGCGAQFISGYAFKGEDFGEEGTPVIKIKNIQNKLVTLKDSQYIPSSLVTQKLSKFILNDGDILIAMTGQGSVGRVGRLQCQGNVRPVMNQRVGKFVADETNLNKDFLFYVISSEPYQRKLFDLGTGSGQPNLSPDTILSLKIPFPNYSHQLAIVEILNSLDNRIAAYHEANSSLEAIAQAVFKSWFVDFEPVHKKIAHEKIVGSSDYVMNLFPDSFEHGELGEMPSGWRVGRVADLGEVVCGKTPPTSDLANYGEDIPFITIPDMHGFLSITSTARSLSKFGADGQSKKYLRKGSVCVSCIATAGLVASVTTLSQTNQQINSVIPSALWGDTFTLLLLRQIGDAVRAGGSGGSVFHNLNKSDFESIPVLLPPSPLALEFARSISPLIEKITENQLLTKSLSNIRDTLLPRLISGQLNVSDIEGLEGMVV